MEVPPWGDPAYPEAFQGAVQAASARFYTSMAEEREADIVTSVSPRGVRVEVGPPNPGIVRWSYSGPGDGLRPGGSHTTRRSSSCTLRAGGSPDGEEEKEGQEEG